MISPFAALTLKSYKNLWIGVKGPIALVPDGEFTASRGGFHLANHLLEIHYLCSNGGGLPTEPTCFFYI